MIKTLPVLKSLNGKMRMPLLLKVVRNEKQMCGARLLKKENPVNEIYIIKNVMVEGRGFHHFYRSIL